ncbi:STAS domain-containing protein [Micromonospora sp. URMC 107]|uniref:STAS domain-containing protein n=1 Tax=Micromonospora sp. URMC 107 TaxID=3423418 RepID=UPI003F19BC82
MIAVDLSAVRFFGAHGVSALLQAQQTATDAGAAFLLRDPAPCVTYILATTGVLPSFTLTERPPRVPRPAAGGQRRHPGLVAGSTTYGNVTPGGGIRER